MPALDAASIQDFHDRRAGGSALVFAGADCGDGRSSYRWLADAVPASARDILDLACGDGALLDLLAIDGRSCTGLDANAAELAAAAHRLEGRSIALCRGLAQQMPFEDDAFDAVTSHMALMLMDDPDAVLAEIARVLRPGGTLAFVVGRSADPGDLSRAVWSRVSARLRAEAITVDLPGGWHTEEGVRGILAPRFAIDRIVPLDLRVAVRFSALGPFFETAYYPIDALSPAASAALMEELREIVQPFVVDGRFSWIFHAQLAVTTPVAG